MTEDTLDHRQVFLGQLSRLERQADYPLHDDARLLQEQRAQLQGLLRGEAAFVDHLRSMRLLDWAYGQLIEHGQAEGAVASRMYFRERHEALIHPLRDASGNVLRDPLGTVVLRGDAAALDLFHLNALFICFVFSRRRWSAATEEVLRRYPWWRPGAGEPWYEALQGEARLVEIARGTLAFRDSLLSLNLRLVINRADLFGRCTPPSHMSGMDRISVAAEGMASAVDKLVLLAIDPRTGRLAQWDGRYRDQAMAPLVEPDSVPVGVPQVNSLPVIREYAVRVLRGEPITADADYPGTQVSYQRLLAYRSHAARSLGLLAGQQGQVWPTPHAAALADTAPGSRDERQFLLDRFRESPGTAPFAWYADDPDDHQLLQQLHDAGLSLATAHRRLQTLRQWRRYLLGPGTESTRPSSTRTDDVQYGIEPGSVFRTVSIGRMVGHLISSYSTTMTHFYPDDRRHLYRINKAVARHQRAGLLGGSPDYESIAEEVNRDPRHKIVRGACEQCGMSEKRCQRRSCLKGPVLPPAERITPDEVARLMAASSVISPTTSSDDEGEETSLLDRSPDDPDSRPDALVEVRDELAALRAAAVRVGRLPLVHQKLLALRAMDPRRVLAAMEKAA